MSKSLLIIDDEPAIVTGLRIRAESAGWQTLSANDGVHGVQLAECHRPQLIVLDMRMPGQDGLQTLAAIRNCPSIAKTPVLMISGTAADHQTALRGGANAYLTKPHRTNDFLRMIEELTKARSILAAPGAPLRHFLSN